LTENEKEVRLRADLPGVNEKDVEISLDGDVLTIRGEKQEERTEDGERRRFVERSYGSFETQHPAAVHTEGRRDQAQLQGRRVDGHRKEAAGTDEALEAHSDPALGRQNVSRIRVAAEIGDRIAAAGNEFRSLRARMLNHRRQEPRSVASSARLIGRFHMRDHAGGALLAIIGERRAAFVVEVVAMVGGVVAEAHSLHLALTRTNG
jgi:hypothetical protein